ncbi:MAG TPA: 6-carboxytetrahydropterin synthase [Acidisarcina sp.]|nr:6-carboxytetrahydropterin synthase [Acidisarcina sp.]
MKAYLSRRYRISASHRLHTEAYDERRNREVYGKCNNPHGHGHNYVVEVTVSGQVDPQTGMICNLGDLDGFMQREVIDRFDHTNLNLDASFQEQVPTTENLCITVFDLVSAGFDKATLVSIRIEETANNYFEYRGKSERTQNRYA